MAPDVEKLAKDYEKSRSTMIIQVDCASNEGQGLCGRMGVQGYPSLKAFKKDGNINRGDDYNGGRDYRSMKKYVETNLAGPECSLEDKEGCEPAELKILEESEKMKPGDRREKIKEMEGQIKDKKKQMKDIEKEIKELEKSLGLVKLGGEKPDRVAQLVGDAEFREHCETRTCVVAFLPHILDGGAKVRNEHLKALETVFKNSKSAGHPVGFMWSQGGDQFESEEKMALSFGFPAVVAINLKKERFGVHRGTFDKDALKGFISQMMIGRVPLAPLPKGLSFSKADPWDGKDGQVPVEEEL